jgi:hypothetical protein
VRIVSVIGVAAPGAIALTVMPNLASSLAADDTRLRGAIVDLADGAEQAGGRGHVDDAAEAPLHHAGRNRLQAVEAAFEMNGDDFVPLRTAHFVQHRGPDDAGVVDENVNTIELFEGSRDHGVDLIASGYIASNADRFGALCAHRAGQSLGPIRDEVRDAYTPSRTRKSPGDSRADALGCPGDDCRSARELHLHVSDPFGRAPTLGPATVRQRAQAGLDPRQLWWVVSVLIDLAQGWFLARSRESPFRSRLRRAAGRVPWSCRSHVR